MNLGTRAEITFRLEAMRVLREIVSLGLRVRAEQGLRVRQPLTELVAVGVPPDFVPWLKANVELITAEVNVKQVRFQ
jgi:hypothetical protein